MKLNIPDGPPARKPFGKREAGSSKVRRLIEDLRIMFQTSDDKCLVVSQWTRFLSLIQLSLIEHEMDYLQLDGTLSVNQRQSVINQFKEGKTRILLVSMRAAGLGLNLVNANRVFMMGKTLS
jgi:SNF2 family DNA or RNA helicase